MNMNAREALRPEMLTLKTSPNRPIGIFDSGLGGLTVVRAVRKLLPSEDIIYFGDVARLPYGIKSPAQIIACSKDNTEFLLDRGVKALVVACNSSASTGLDILHAYYRLPLIVDVIQPAVAEALRRTKNGRIGLLGTQATVASGAYERYIRRQCGRRKISLFSEAAPLLVPLVESGWLREEVTKKIVLRYLKPILTKRIDTLILGCTHYPLLKHVFQACVSSRVHVIDAAPFVAKSLQDGLTQSGLRLPQNGRAGKLQVYLSDIPQDFKRIGESFLGERLAHVKKVSVE